MQQAFTATTEATPDELFAVVGDLTTYPHWLDLVDAVAPDGESGSSQGWIVTLKARVGPFSRSKRLRMIRTVHEQPAVRFERQELDGRDHSAWVLEAVVSPVGLDTTAKSRGSELALSLRYDGSMWSGLLDGVLDSAAARATERLRTYVKT